MFIIHHDFTFYNIAYNSDRRSVTYHKRACADLLAENGEIWKTFIKLLQFAANVSSNYMIVFRTLCCRPNYIKLLWVFRSTTQNVIDNYPITWIPPLCLTDILSTVTFASKRRRSSVPCKATCPPHYFGGVTMGVRNIRRKNHVLQHFF
jgi:hypothetical protein